MPSRSILVQLRRLGLVLSTVEQHDGVTARHVAGAAGMSKASALRYLSMLAGEGAIRSAPAGKQRLTWHSSRGAP